MNLRIDRQMLIPVVQQIISAVAEWIRQHHLCPGTRLPSIRQLAKDNLLSQATVVEAYDRLVAQGVLERRNGSGFFVAMPAKRVQAQVEREWYEGLELGWGAFTDSPLGELKLGCGWVPESWRESDDISYAIRQVTRTQMPGLFNYSTPLGLPSLRWQLHKRQRYLGIQVAEDQILITHGATHALDLLARVLLKAGDAVLVETPGYPSLYQLLKLHGVRLLEVPRTPGGPDIQVLQQLLQDHKPKCLFINSLFHNPTGSSLTPVVAQQVLELANAHDFFIVEDGIYADLQGGFATQLAALDFNQRVIYVASFSKTLSCSLRVGYICASTELIGQLAQIKMITSLGASRFAESVVASVLANGTYLKLVQRLRQRLSKAMAATLEVLDDTGWEVFAKPAGGMFIWARNTACSAAQLKACAERYGVLLSQDALFNPGGTACDWLRINVAYATDPRALGFFGATESPESVSACLATPSV